MIVPSLYSELRSRGVLLEIAKTPDYNQSPELPPLRLHIRAPEGALNDALRTAISDFKGELLQFVFELEETAAILQVMQGNRIEESQELARDCVRGGRATPDGGLWLREYAERCPDVRTVQDIFGGEIVSAERTT